MGSLLRSVKIRASGSPTARGCRQSIIQVNIERRAGPVKDDGMRYGISVQIFMLDRIQRSIMNPPFSDFEKKLDIYIVTIYIVHKYIKSIQKR